MKPPLAVRGKVLLQSDKADPLLDAVEAALRQLETLCGRLERALMLRKWDELEQAIADSRRFTHALQNAMDDARSARDRAFDERVARRLYYIHAIRQNQMERLQHYHDEVGQRLHLMSRWKSALKTLSQRATAPVRAGAIDGLR